MLTKEAGFGNWGKFQNMANPDFKQFSKSLASGNQNIKEMGSDLAAIPYGLGRSLYNIPAVAYKTLTGDFGGAGEDAMDVLKGLGYAGLGAGKTLYDLGGAAMDYGRSGWNLLQSGQAGQVLRRLDNKIRSNLGYGDKPEDKSLNYYIGGIDDAAVEHGKGIATGTSKRTEPYIKPKKHLPGSIDDNYEYMDPHQGKGSRVQEYSSIVNKIPEDAISGVIDEINKRKTN